MKSTIFDSDINYDKLDELISSNKELEALKCLGEISVEVEADESLEEEDNTFDAPYQEEIVTGGQINYNVSNLKVFWSPDEKDLEFLEDCVTEGTLSKDVFKSIKNKFFSEPKSNNSYEITSIILEEPLEELKEEFIEENRD